MGKTKCITAPGDDGEDVVIATVEIKTEMYTDQNGIPHKAQVAEMTIYNAPHPKVDK